MAEDAGRHRAAPPCAAQARALACRASHHASRAVSRAMRISVSRRSRAAPRIAHRAPHERACRPPPRRSASSHRVSLFACVLRTTIGTKTFVAENADRCRLRKRRLLKAGDTVPGVSRAARTSVPAPAAPSLHETGCMLAIAGTRAGAGTDRSIAQYNAALHVETQQNTVMMRRERVQRRGLRSRVQRRRNCCFII